MPLLQPLLRRLCSQGDYSYPWSFVASTLGFLNVGMSVIYFKRSFNEASFADSVHKQNTKKPYDNLNI